METVTVEARDLAPLAEALDEAIAPALRLDPPALDARLLGAALGARRPPSPEPAAAAAVVGQGRDRLAPAAGGRLVHRRLGEPRRASSASGPLGADPMPRPCSPPAASTILPCDRRRWPGPGAPRWPWCWRPMPGGVPAEAPGEAPAAVVDALLRRLLDAQPEGDARRALAVAALARVTSPSLLAEVLPDCDAERAFSWLSAQPSAEPLGDGVTLHDLVGQGGAGRPAPPLAGDRARPAPAAGRRPLRAQRARGPAATDARPPAPGPGPGDPVGILVGHVGPLPHRRAAAGRRRGDRRPRRLASAARGWRPRAATSTRPPTG